MKPDALTDSTSPRDGLRVGSVPGGTFLADFLYPAPAERRVGAIIGWWEKRRLPYNLIIGGSGLLSATVVASFMTFNGAPGLLEWLQIGLFWLIAANACYTLGPAAEIALQKFLGRRLLPAGPLLFRAGLTIALGVALAPVIFVTIAYLATALGVGP
ncbi:MAG: hypothetical protein F4Z33_01255 [Gemmatimonadales bacterium]|nr:hypothetical protein [Gemmatimonadales bacterium]MXX77624.1 hypothetical protein [Gemmatimonadales bacterium]MYC87706.1 hypothetical protein [Candidatus Palauibacter denitrificans]